MCFWCSVLRKVVKISFAKDPQSGQRYRDAIGDFRTADAAADLVMEERDHSYHTAQNRHDEQQNRSEARRVGKECVGKCRSRRWPDYSKTKITLNRNTIETNCIKKLNGL